jgi:D-3-phosphoglycerate dehydrogenase
VRALVLAPFDEVSLARLRALGDVVYESWLETRRLQDPDELGERLARDGVDVLVVEADFVFEEVFDRAPALRLVGVCRNALNQVDLESAAEHGVLVTHAPGRNTNAVAEMTLALMLALARRIVPAHQLVAGGGWRDPAAGYLLMRGREIAGSTVGVVGFGQIGREVARRCITLGARVVVHDPLVPVRDVQALGCDAVALAELASRSDFVTLHVPENDATYRMIDGAFLSAMQRDAYLINTSVGAVVDTPALVDALESGRIAGAALDVFEGQPLPISSPLLSAPNVILTPHIGGATTETVERHSRIIAEEIERMVAGEPLQHEVTVHARTTSAL